MQESPANPESREAAPGPGEPLVSCAASNGSPRQDLGRGQWDMAFKADKDVIYHLCEVAGGKVVYGGCDNKVYVGNLKTGKRSKTFTVEELDVCCLAVDPNDDSIFFTSGSEVSATYYVEVVPPLCTLCIAFWLVFLFTLLLFYCLLLTSGLCCVLGRFSGV